MDNYTSKWPSFQYFKYFDYPIGCVSFNSNVLVRGVKLIKSCINIIYYDKLG